MVKHCKTRKKKKASGPEHGVLSLATRAQVSVRLAGVEQLRLRGSVTAQRAAAASVEETNSFSGLHRGSHRAAGCALLLLPVSQHQDPELLLGLFQQQRHLVLRPAGGWRAGSGEGRGGVALPLLLLLLTGGGGQRAGRADPGLHAGRLAVAVALDGRDDGDGVGAERRRRRRRWRRRAAGAAARPAQVAAGGGIQGAPERRREGGGALLLVA